MIRTPTNHIVSAAVCIALAALVFPLRVHAVSVSDPAAEMVTARPVHPDTRTGRLKRFLSAYDSPLAAEAATFVAEADRYNIDWRLVAAISGVESTFGRHIPEGSYNGWGWGIPTGASSGIAFSSWENGIHTVSQGLAENYFGRGARTLDDVGRIYAASPAWAWKVRFFIEKITDFSVTDPEAIPLSL